MGIDALSGLLPFILIFGLFYFLIIRPQQTREKRHKNMLEEVSKGDIVVTQGGLQGRVDGVSEDGKVLRVNIAEGVRVEVRRSHIAFVVKGGELIEG